MSILLEQAINGVLMGGGMALAASGLALVYGTMRIVQFAHGEFYLLGAYGAAALAAGGLPYPLAGFCGVIIGVAAGLIAERVVFRSLMGRPPLSSLIASLGLSVAMVSVFLLLTKGNTVSVDLPLAIRPLTVVGCVIPAYRVLVGLTALSVMACLHICLKYTLLGKRVRAVVADRRTAMLVGIDGVRLSQVVFAASGALAALSGVLSLPTTGVTPFTGGLVTLRAFAVIVLGGFNNIVGITIAGVVIGVIEAVAVSLLSGSAADLAIFALLSGVLIARPRGIVKEQGGSASV